MRIVEFETLFQDESRLNEALEKLKEDIEKVDYWAGLMKENITSNAEEAIKALNELTGTFSNLRTALSIAEIEKKNREIKAYNKLRIEAGNAGTKFVATVATAEASGVVSNYRRVRNIISAYKESCEKMVSSLQSLLKYMVVDYHNESSR